LITIRFVQEGTFVSEGALQCDFCQWHTAANMCQERRRCCAEESSWLGLCWSREVKDFTKINNMLQTVDWRRPNLYSIVLVGHCAQDKSCAKPTTVWNSRFRDGERTHARAWTLADPM